MGGPPCGPSSGTSHCPFPTEAGDPAALSSALASSAAVVLGASSRLLHKTLPETRDRIQVAVPKIPANRTILCGRPLSVVYTRPSLRASTNLGRIALHAAPVEKRAKGAREYRDGRYRVRLQEDVEHARRCRDRVW